MKNADPLLNTEGDLVAKDVGTAKVLNVTFSSSLYS